MPDAARSKQIVALVLMASAAMFWIVATLIFIGVVPVGEDIRVVAGTVVGIVGFADFLIGLWFFRMGQSS